VRTPTNLFEEAVTVEVFFPKEVIVRRIQDIFVVPNKDRKTVHSLVVWEDYKRTSSGNMISSQRRLRGRTVTPKDKDEVNKRDVCECDG